MGFFRRPPVDGVDMKVTVRINAGALAKLSPDRIVALMNGIAHVLAATEQIKRSTSGARAPQGDPEGKG